MWVCRDGTEVEIGGDGCGACKSKVGSNGGGREGGRDCGCCGQGRNQDLNRGGGGRAKLKTKKKIYENKN